MKSLVVYYSYTGNTKRLAQELAAQEAADIAEVRDLRRPGKIKAFSLGCLAAMCGKPWSIQPLNVDWGAYDRLILCAPVWAGNPPPAVYSLLERLPRGKAVSVKMVSGSGQSQCKARLEQAMQGKGCTLEGFADIKMG